MVSIDGFEMVEYMLSVKQCVFVLYTIVILSLQYVLRMILVLDDTCRYESLPSIDTKSHSSLFDVTMTSESRKTVLPVLDENRQNFTFSTKILGICDFDGGFRLT